ncbi:MAG: helix-turn-helix domain-containing protein [Clostridiaceae bacterium]|nr:helix-turn-helix domain-containing protein [Clostridiaceae bacterium]
MVAKSTYFYVEEVGYFKTRSTYFTERENLNSYLIIFVLSGKGYLEYKGKSYTIYKGQGFLIDCMEYQYYRADAKDPWEILWVHFNGGTSYGYYQQFSKNSSPLCSFEENTIVPSILHELISTHQEINIRTEPLSSKLLLDLLTEFLFTINIPDSSETFVPEYIKRIMKELDRGLQEKITLDMLAQKYSMNKFHLEKEFKKFIGISPNEYVISNRISLGKELLKYSDLPVSEISFKTGIDNVSHFINLFKNREGITPLAFRKKWQGPEETKRK